MVLLKRPEPITHLRVHGRSSETTGNLIAAAFSVGLHLAVAALVLVKWTQTPDAPPPKQPAMMIELAPLPSAPPAPPEQVAPGVQQVEKVEPVEVEDKPLDLPPVPVVAVKNPPVVVPKKPEFDPDPTPTPRPTPIKPRQPVQQTTAPASVPLPPREKAGAPAVGTPTASDQVAEQTWQGQVLAKLEKSKRYPSESRQDKEEDRVLMTIKVDRSGRVLDRVIVRSRGNARLDAEAMAVVMRASPFPAPPASIRNADLTFNVYIDFLIAQPRGRRR